MPSNFPCIYSYCPHHTLQESIWEAVQSSWVLQMSLPHLFKKMDFVQSHRDVVWIRWVEHIRQGLAHSKYFAFAAIVLEMRKLKHRLDHLLRVTQQKGDLNSCLPGWQTGKCTGNYKGTNCDDKRAWRLPQGAGYAGPGQVWKTCRRLYLNCGLKLGRRAGDGRGRVGIMHRIPGETGWASARSLD